MKIVIGASKNNLIGSKAIQWWMKTKYSHVYSRWHLNSQDKEIVYQASHGMVHFVSYENFIKSNEIVEEFTLELTDIQFKEFSAKCIDLAGEKYSKLELFQIFIQGISNNNIKFADQSGYICSELMCELLESLGCKFDKPKHLVTPRDIIETLRLK